MPAPLARDRSITRGAATGHGALDLRHRRQSSGLEAALGQHAAIQGLVYQETSSLHLGSFGKLLVPVLGVLVHWGQISSRGYMEGLYIFWQLPPQTCLGDCWCLHASSEWSTCRLCSKREVLRQQSELSRAAPAPSEHQYLGCC